ncbi:TPA: hypothetical protein VDV10_006322, partial [Pseudomonas aeruginosa]|nr:hypothetical protein [Pseudomonas aeruginosa]
MEVQEIKNETRWKKITEHAGAAVSLAGFLGLIASGAYWIDNYIDQKISTRTAPFESLLSGISLIQDEEYDEAVE